MHTVNVRQRNKWHYAARIVDGRTYPAWTAEEIHYPVWDDLAVGQSVRANYQGNTNWGMCILKLDDKRKRALIIDASNLRRWIEHNDINVVFGENLPDISKEAVAPTDRHSIC